MKVDRLAMLRRVNPVRVADVAPLVAAQRSTLLEMIGASQEQPIASADYNGPTISLLARPSRSTRFGLIGAVGATLVAFALPVMFLATTGRGGDVNIDDIETDSPGVGQLSTSDGPDVAEGRPEPQSTDVVVSTTVPPSASVDQRQDSAAQVAPVSSPSSSPPATDPSLAPPSVAPPGNAPIAPSPTVAPAAPAAPVSPAPTTVAPPAQPAPVTTVASPAPPAPDTTVAPPAPSTSSATTAPPAPTTIAPPSGTRSGNTTGQPFDPAVDLLVVTFDFANRDDAHAAAASRELASSYGLDPLVVAGTQAATSPSFVQPYSTVMTAAWGSGWLDASANRSAAIATAADRWLQTIDSGGVVRVAEGGVSDFTADVVREVRSRRPSLDTAAVIQVVHHNQRNEDETRSGDLDLVQTATAYVRIDDGNSANGTADLNAQSSSFVSAALAGRHADAWTVAFDYLSSGSLDFSDTVTMLHILGVGTDQVADPDDFAARFMG